MKKKESKAILKSKYSSLFSYLLKSLLLFPLLFFLTAIIANGNDLEEVKLKKFDKEYLDQLKQDPDLNYGDSEEGIMQKLENAFQSFKNWIADQIFEFFSTKVSGDSIDLAFYILGIIIIIIALYYILKSRGVNIFSKSKGEDSNIILYEERVPEIDFSKKINAAMDSGDFRSAIRLMYLRSLQILDKDGKIEWTPFKTDQDYLAEIDKPNLKVIYERMTYIFDFIWYGHFKADKAVAQKMSGLLEKIQTEISSNEH